MLLKEEMHQNTRNEEDLTFSTVTNKGKGKDSSNPSFLDNKKKKKKKKIKCFFCNKSWHKQKEC